MNYCEADSQETQQLIEMTHIANWVKDMTLIVMNTVRLVYMTYVLVYVCRTSENFWKRPAFMNLLPVLNIAYSIFGMAAGVYLLYYTASGGGQVICEITRSTEILTIFGTFICALDHYIFSAEFLNTYKALQMTIKGLEISCSEFVRQNTHLAHNRPQSADSQATIRQMERMRKLKERMEMHEKATREGQRLL